MFLNISCLLYVWIFVLKFMIYTHVAIPYTCACTVSPVILNVLRFKYYLANDSDKTISRKFTKTKMASIM